MKIWMGIIIVFLVTIFSVSAQAHSGRTDGNGGHNCSDKSIAKGLCSGYHYHNGGGDSSSGGSSSGSSSSGESSSQTIAPVKSTYNPKVYYDKGYNAGQAKGYENGYSGGQKNVDVNDSNKDYAEGWTAGYEKGFKEGESKKLAEEKEKKDRLNGETTGKTDGQKAYKAGKANDAFTYQSNSSDTYKSSYESAFIIAWEHTRDTESCHDEGFKQGLLQEDVVATDTCESKEMFTFFKTGHQEGVAERDESEEKRLSQEGFATGYAASELSIPIDVKKESYIISYKEGYEKGFEKRKQEVKSEGFEAAFETLTISESVYKDQKVFQEWYKEGFNENLIAKEIKEKAQLIGEESDEYVIDEKYKVNDASISLYDSLFYKGQEIRQQKEEEQKKENTIMFSLAAIAAPAAGGVYFLRRKRKTADK